MTALNRQLQHCRTRRAFLSRKLAVGTAWLERAAGIAPPLDPYHCPHCGDWHLRRRRSA